MADRKRAEVGVLRRQARERWNIVRLAPRAGLAPVLSLTLANLVLGVLPVLFIVATSTMIGRVPAAALAGLHSAAWRSLVTIFTLAALAFVAQQVLATVVTALRDRVARRIDGQVFAELMAASLRSPGIGPLEDQQTLDDLAAASLDLQFGFQSPGQAVPGLLALIARYTQLAGYAVIVAVAFSPLAGCGLVVTVLALRYGQRGGLGKYVAVRFTLTAAERKLYYFRMLNLGSLAAKEIRAFGLIGFLRGTLRDAYAQVLGPIWAKRRSVYLWPFVWIGLWGLLVTSVTFAALGATASTRTLAALTMVVQAFVAALRLGEFYPEADNQTAIGMHAHDAVRRFAARASAVEDSAAPPADGRAAVSGLITGGVPEPASEIRFSDVTFGYPGRDRPVLDGLNLTIPAGQTTAIVGLNGAGKTTLVKLLARLYEPGSGAVLADGVDIRRYPVGEWRSRLGIIFQNFARYEASIADNIGFGSVGSMADRDGILAAAQAVGLGEFVASLPAGLDTPLARHMTGGVDLSGGQWQRIALARAVFALRHGAPVLVLDEPTASLDVRAEAQFFDDFATWTRGATTVLISHRFSTVRQADSIVVLDQGRVTEQGSHAGLMAAGGQYAELFRLQADRFADVAEAER